MPKRVKQHQLEDLSRAKFQLAIPEEWVCRDKDKDYGVDVEIEVFDDKGLATGQVFWVQLKATGSDKAATIKSLDINIDRVRYYQTLEIPVLIARYSQKEDRFYYKWANNIDLYFATEKAKTHKISFTDDDIWDEHSHLKVTEYLNKVRAIKQGRIKLPMPVFVEVKEDRVNKTPKGVFVSSFRAALKEFRDFLVFKHDVNDSLIKVTLCGDEMEIDLASLGHCTFHSIKLRDDDGFVEGIVADALLGCAMSLMQVGQHEIAARIILDKRLWTRVVNNKELLFHSTPSLLATSYFSEVIDKIKDVIVTEKDNRLEAIVLSTTIVDANNYNEEKLLKLEEFLQKCLEKYLALNEDPLTGTAFYNLGNHYRSRGLYKEAIECYFQAKRYEKIYLKQPYYYQEIAGALFLLEKYCFASKVYQIALDRGAPPNVRPLYADALMHSGKYNLALDVFTDHLKDCEGNYNEEWHLKQICLTVLVKENHVRDKVRHNKDALEIISTSKPEDKDYLKSLEQALELDLLCGTAWFNLGIKNSVAGEYRDAAFNFTMAAIIKTGDVEAWVNAVLCCLNEKNTLEMLPLIVRVGFFFNEDDFLTKLYEELNEKSNPEISGKFASLIEEIIPKSADKRDMPALRILGKDGIFHDVLDEKQTHH